MRQKDAVRSGGNFFGLIKTVVIAVIISLALVLVMAFVIKIFNIDNRYIALINQIIKGISILSACLISLKFESNGWLWGLMTGILYIVFAFVVFSLLDGEFNIGLSLINDIALGGVSGLISGIIAVNLRK